MITLLFMEKQMVECNLILVVKTVVQTGRAWQCIADNISDFY